MIVRTAMVVDMGNGKEEYVDSKVYNVIMHKGYMQGRTEAIDEFIAKIEEHIAYSYERIEYTDLARIAEQIKEK